MAGRKTKTQQKPKTRVNVKDAEKQKNSDINVRDEGNSEAVHQTFTLDEPSNRIRTWWFIEVWEERREVFKNLAFHIAITIIGIVFLIQLHSYIEGSSLPHDEKELFQKMDFYIMAIVLGFFGIEFVYKMATIIIKDIKDGR